MYLFINRLSFHRAHCLNISDINWHQPTVVAVLNWNRAGLTVACVKSLLAQTHRQFQVVVMDNDSAAADWEALSAFCQKHAPMVQCCRFNENIGFAAAHNKLAEAASSAGVRHFTLLNNDAEAEPQWLAALLANGATLVASQMRQMSAPHVIDNTGHAMLNTAEIFPRDHGRNVNSVLARQPLIGACGGAALVHLPTFIKLGGFDEHFFLGYEDAEYGLRHWLCGFDLAYEPAAIVRHHGSASLSELRSTSYLATIQSHIFYSWFVLMPASVLWFNAPFLFLKYSAVFILDLLLLRFRFFMVMATAVDLTWQLRTKISNTRKKFQAQQQIKRSFFEIQRRMVFFLGFDARRFLSLIIKNKRSALEP